MSPAYQEMINGILNQFWQYYHQLAESKESPEFKSISIFENIFDEIFNQKTAYQSLDNKLAAIAKNKEN